MNLTEYPRLAEQLYRCELSNGLQVMVVPRPGFQRKIAYFVTDFGSLDRHFRWKGQEWTVPQGIAHYLEHQMFHLPDKDPSAEFTALGAGVNAFTSYEKTGYYFTCTDNFDACLKLLLEMVSTPWFSEESVEKERGIIDQEIGMYADNPESQNYAHMLEVLYPGTEIANPVLGTRETIRQITPELLKLCHEAFYSPANMHLCVIGDVDPQTVSRIALDCLGSELRPIAEKFPQPLSEMTCTAALQENHMQVAVPNFYIGFKAEPAGRGESSMREEVIGDLAAEAVFGESSKLYLELYEKGIIDSSLGGGYETYGNYAFVSCSGDSEEPERVRSAILEWAAKLAEQGIEEEEFNRTLRSFLGRRLRGLDNFDSFCYSICSYYLRGVDYLRFPEIYESIRAEDVRELIARVFRPERCTMTVVYPNEKESSANE